MLTMKNVTSGTNNLAVGVHFVRENPKFSLRFTFCRKFLPRSKIILQSRAGIDFEIEFYLEWEDRLG